MKQSKFYFQAAVRKQKRRKSKDSAKTELVQANCQRSKEKLGIRPSQTVS